MKSHPNPDVPARPTITVVGVGGAGVNSVAHLHDSGLPGVTLVAIDSSNQSLARLSTSRHASVQRVLLASRTRGLGAGRDAVMGALAARADSDAILAALGQPDIVFLVAGVAGGTGGGASPVIAALAKETGALVVGCAVLPFGFEPPRRHEAAAVARAALAEACDAWLVLDNRKAVDVAGKAIGLDGALRVADDVLRQAVQGLAEMVGDQGTIDVDLPAVRAVLTGAGRACVALGACCRRRSSAWPARDAMRAALESPLCDMRGLAHAKGVLLQISGGVGLCIDDAAAAVALLETRVPATCRVLVGVACREGLGGSAQVMLLGTGLCTSAVSTEADTDIARGASAASGTMLPAPLSWSSALDSRTRPAAEHAPAAERPNVGRSEGRRDNVPEPAHHGAAFRAVS